MLGRQQENFRSVVKMIAVNYECLPYENFPVATNWRGFLENEIIQAEESLQIHWENYADMVCRRVASQSQCSEAKSLIDHTKFKFKAFKRAEFELNCGNNLPAIKLRDEKVEKLNEQINQILSAGGNRETVKSKLLEMNDIRVLK